MINIFWMFVGVISGLLIVSVFTPPDRKVPTLPTPDNNQTFKTPNGCVRFKSQEVECGSSASSLNFMASQNKW
jgi:hypothetical protein